jgi:hypothetical protein
MSNNGDEEDDDNVNEELTQHVAAAMAAINADPAKLDEFAQALGVTTEELAEIVANWKATRQ